MPRGRPPKPVALRLIEGTTKAGRSVVSHRPVERGEPRPELALAVLPAHLRWLDAEAKACWNRLAPELVRLGLLTKLDQELFAVYCVSWSTWVRAVRTLDREGLSFTRPSVGSQAVRPEVQVAAAATHALAQIGAKFGLSPADRARIRVTPPEPTDEF